ncbi:PTS transporter subunit EIIC [Desemzia incerta]|uniref:PTS transporter subunit EIIC n=1 Tax=Desemzia incerta TaxID=82801 RepID=UPI00331557D6
MPLSETVYTSTVIPAILLVWLLSYLERILERILPEAVTRLFTPLFSILIAVPLTIMVIGPLAAAGANVVAAGYTALAVSFPALAGIIIGGAWQLFVLLGVHWGITPVILANHEQYGMDTFQVYQTIAVISQVGAALAVFLKTKKKEVRSVSFSAAITGLFGITEPAIYGVNLRFKKPFFIGIFTGAIASLVTSFFNAFSFVYTGLPGPLTIINTYSSDYPSSFWGVLIGTIIALVLPIVLVQIFGYGDDVDEETIDAPLTTAENR